MTGHVPFLEPTRAGLWPRVLWLGVWSVISGAALGVALRLAMRFVALEACVPPGFSVGGSLEVVAAATLLGAPLTAAFLALPERQTRRMRWSGAVVGLAVFGVLALLPPPAARSALADTPDTPAATAAAFALCFASWGAAVERIARSRSAARHPLPAR